MTFELYHGKGTDTISYGHLLTTGQGVSEDMWDVNPENRLSVLKLLCSQSHIPIMQGNDVNLDFLSRMNFKSMELLSGISLMQAADKGTKNLEKARVLVQKYLDEAGNPKISEDNSMEAVVNKVLDDMWFAANENHYDAPKKKQRCGKMSHKIETELEGEDDVDDEEDKNDDSGEN